MKKTRFIIKDDGKIRVDKDSDYFFMWFILIFAVAWFLFLFLGFWGIIWRIIF